jgi:hypothetical protein
MVYDLCTFLQPRYVSHFKQIICEHYFTRFFENMVTYYVSVAPEELCAFNSLVSFVVNEITIKLLLLLLLLLFFFFVFAAAAVHSVSVFFYILITLM